MLIEWPGEWQGIGRQYSIEQIGLVQFCFRLNREPRKQTIISVAILSTVYCNDRLLIRRQRGLWLVDGSNAGKSNFSDLIYILMFFRFLRHAAEEGE